MLKLPGQVKSINTILRDDNHILHLLVTQSQELKSVQQIVASTIPVEFAICSIKGGIISIMVSKATEATSVMYREEEILSALSEKKKKNRVIGIVNSPRLIPRRVRMAKVCMTLRMKV